MTLAPSSLFLPARYFDPIPWLFLLQSEESQIPQPLLICQMLQAFNLLCKPLPDSLQYVHLSCSRMPWTGHSTPREHTSLQLLVMHFLMPARRLSAFLESRHIAAYQDTQIFSAKMLFQPVSPGHSDAWSDYSWGVDMAPDLLNLKTFFYLFFQLVKVLVSSSIILLCIGHSSWL